MLSFTAVEGGWPYVIATDEDCLEVVSARRPLLSDRAQPAYDPTMRVDFAAAIFVVFAFVAAGCGSDTPGGGDALSRCESAPKVATEFLDVVLPPGMTLGDAVAVRATDDDSVYIIAANVDGQPAVWFASAKHDAGVVWSVNQHAVDVSAVGKAQAGGSISIDDVEAAVSCLP